MANFNKIWKNFLTEGTFQQKSADNDELYEFETLENPKNDEKLLREVTEEELHHIYRAIEEMEASDLAFNELFDGKKRVVVDFPALNTTTELGRFINLWRQMGYDVDWQKGVISGERELKTTDIDDMIALFQSATGVMSPEGPDIKVTKRKVQMKIGKFLSKVIQIKTKLNNLKNEVRAKAPNTIFKMRVVVEVLGDRAKDFYRLGDQLEMLVGSAWAHTITHNEGLAEQFADYWQKNADYIKKNLDTATDNRYSIIITRHPIDILRMGDFDDIESCHSPPSRSGAGEYYKCAVAEAHGHGAVAYVVETEELLDAYDKKTISQVEDDPAFQDDEVFRDHKRDLDAGDVDPVSRLRLRQVRHYEEDEALNSSFGIGTELAVPERRIYGTKVPGFRDRLLKWARENQSEQLRTAPRSPDYPYTKQGEEPWQFGTLNLSRFIKFGGSHEDTLIYDLIRDLFGDLPARGIPVQDTQTQSDLDVSLVGGLIERYQAECDEISERFNSMMANTSVEGTAHDDGADSVYISVEARITIRWDEDEWKTWPNLDSIGWALQELEEMGYNWVKSDYVHDFRRSPLTAVKSLTIDVEPEHLVGFDGNSYAYAPDHYEDFCLVVDKEVDEKRDAVKHYLTHYFKREGDIKGGALMKLGRDVQNEEMGLYHWEAEAEEGYEMDEFELVTFIAHPVLQYKKLGLSKEQAVNILKSRDFWLDIRKRMAAPAFENTGYNYYPDICLDCDLINDASLLDEDEEIEANLHLFLGEEAPDEVVEVLRELVEIWDDQEEIDRVANEVLAQIAKKAPVSEAYNYDDMKELSSINKIERLLWDT